MADSPLLIAVDKNVVDDLKAFLQANLIQLEQVRQQISERTGNEPMTLKQAAAYLNVARTTLRTYIDRGEITPSTYGSRVWVVRSELDNFISRNRRKDEVRRS